jgi:RNA polymerase primary sigma factor
VEQIASLSGIDADEVQAIKLATQTPVSLTQPTGDGEGPEMAQVMASPDCECPHQRAVAVLTSQALHDALQTLSYRERRVLELRYGLGGQPEHTREQLAQRFNVTPDRIRQIENHSLTKLQRLPTLSSYDTTSTHIL